MNETLLKVGPGENRNSRPPTTIKKEDWLQNEQLDMTPFLAMMKTASELEETLFTGMEVINDTYAVAMLLHTAFLQQDGVDFHEELHVGIF